MFHFQITDSKMKNKKLHFELLKVDGSMVKLIFFRFQVSNSRFKIRLVVDMVRKNWSWIVVASCGLHYFVLPCFGSFWVFANFSTAESFKCLLFTAMKIHIMERMIKKQSNFIFSSLVTQTCQMCFISTVGYGIIVQAPLFKLY